MTLASMFLSYHGLDFRGSFIRTQYKIRFTHREVNPDPNFTFRISFGIRLGIGIGIGCSLPGRNRERTVSCSSHSLLIVSVGIGLGLGCPFLCHPDSGYRLHHWYQNQHQMHISGPDPHSASASASALATYSWAVILTPDFIARIRIWLGCLFLGHPHSGSRY